MTTKRSAAFWVSPSVRNQVRTARRARATFIALAAIAAVFGLADWQGHTLVDRSDSRPVRVGTVIETTSGGKYSEATATIEYETPPKRRTFEVERSAQVGDEVLVFLTPAGKPELAEEALNSSMSNWFAVAALSAAALLALAGVFFGRCGPAESLARSWVPRRTPIIWGAPRVIPPIRGAYRECGTDEVYWLRGIFRFRGMSGRNDLPMSNVSRRPDQSVLLIGPRGRFNLVVFDNVSAIVSSSPPPAGPLRWLVDVRLNALERKLRSSGRRTPARYAPRDIVDVGQADPAEFNDDVTVALTDTERGAIGSLARSALWVAAIEATIAIVIAVALSLVAWQSAVALDRAATRAEDVVASLGLDTVIGLRDLVGETPMIAFAAASTLAWFVAVTRTAAVVRASWSLRDAAWHLMSGFVEAGWLGADKRAVIRHRHCLAVGIRRLPSTVRSRDRDAAIFVAVAGRGIYVMDPTGTRIERFRLPSGRRGKSLRRDHAGFANISQMIGESQLPETWFDQTIGYLRRVRALIAVALVVIAVWSAIVVSQVPTEIDRTTAHMLRSPQVATVEHVGANLDVGNWLVAVRLADSDERVWVAASGSRPSVGDKVALILNDTAHPAIVTDGFGALLPDEGSTASLTLLVAVGGLVVLWRRRRARKATT